MVLVCNLYKSKMLIQIRKVVKWSKLNAYNNNDKELS